MDTDQEHQARKNRWLLLLSSRGPQANAVIAESGISFQSWRLYQHFWLVCLLFPLIRMIQSPTSLAQMLSGIGALVFFAAGYTWLMWRHPIERDVRGQARLQRLLWLVLVGEALVLSLTNNLSFLWLFIGVSAIAGVLFPPGQTFIVVSLLMFLPPILSVIVNGSLAEVDWPFTIALMLLVRALGLDMLGVVRLGNALRELHATRKELARRSVEEERQRLSRDLHDLLGQTLSIIALKSELATLLVFCDQQRCVQEIADIEQVARTSLREVREAVAGYRQPCLESELEGARQLLEAAGIEVQIDAFHEALPPAVDAALAWVIREGVTNVIRHSHARWCRIHLTRRDDTVEVEVCNDGREREREEITTRRSLGLAGLRERVGMLGGSLYAGPLSLPEQAGFRLCGELPIRPEARTPHIQEEQG